jgi:hypothetical protein
MLAEFSGGAQNRFGVEGKESQRATDYTGRMLETALELLPEVVSLALVALGTVTLSGLGVYAEELGAAAMAEGQLGLGLWFVVVGAVALFAGGYQLGYRTLLPRLRAYGDGA